VARRRLSIAAFVGIGLAVAVALVLFVSPWADSDPDGLAKMAADTGIAGAERASATSRSPLAGYGVEGHDGVGKGLAGLIGVAVTFLVVAILLWLVRRRRGSRPADTGVA
jgi:cobalt/nickel transport system permease protein